MKMPTWKVKIYARIYNEQFTRNPMRVLTVAAHTGAQAQERALRKRPNWTVLSCERLTGYEDNEEVGNV